uniref:Uncharacterized protein n=1 Tax=Solanum tuberosum TaxID=4113 RepID=M1DBI1_SOLTU
MLSYSHLGSQGPPPPYWLNHWSRTTDRKMIFGTLGGMLVLPWKWHKKALSQGTLHDPSPWVMDIATRRSYASRNAGENVEREAPPQVLVDPLVKSDGHGRSEFQQRFFGKGSSNAPP